MQYVLPVAASGFFGLIYVGYPLMLLPLFAAKENGKHAAAVPDAGGVDGRYCGAVCGQSVWPAQAGTGAEPQQDMGRCAGASLAGAVLVAGILALACALAGSA